MTNRYNEPNRADILVVDDTPENLRLLSQMLGEQGYQVRPVTSGSMALTAVQADPPDLILLDIKMAGMDGYQVCQRLKADDKTREIPILFISALGDTQDKVKAFSAGGVDYITKPFHFEEVLARVKTHLSLRTLQKQLQESNRKMEQELNLAGEIQISFLRSKLPEIPGWEISVSLWPARETCGDFYDVFCLPEGRIGILIADVVDKGVSAALFMAFCCALIRTYTSDFPMRSDVVFSTLNSRILKDTTASQFVTIFYSVLEPDTGELLYSNAGHPPGFIFRSSVAEGVRTLERTGLPLGIFERERWRQERESMQAGDLMVLYTDGIPDALNECGESFGEGRFRNLVEENAAKGTQEIRDAFHASMKTFTGGQPQYDDMALILLKRS